MLGQDGSSGNRLLSSDGRMGPTRHFCLGSSDSAEGIDEHACLVGRPVGAVVDIAHGAVLFSSGDWGDPGVRIVAGVREAGVTDA